MRFRVDLSVRGILTYWVDAPDVTQAIEISLAEFQADLPPDSQRLTVSGTTVETETETPILTEPLEAVRLVL